MFLTKMGCYLLFARIDKKLSNEEPYFKMLIKAFPVKFVYGHVGSQFVYARIKGELACSLKICSIY